MLSPGLQVECSNGVVVGSANLQISFIMLCLHAICLYVQLCCRFAALAGGQNRKISLALFPFAPSILTGNAIVCCVYPKLICVLQPYFYVNERWQQNLKGFFTNRKWVNNHLLLQEKFSLLASYAILSFILAPVHKSH